MGCQSGRRADVSQAAGRVPGHRAGPNNARVVTWDGDRDGKAHLWDVDVGVVIATLPAEVKPEENDYLFSPDGALLAVATDDAVELWDAVSGRQKDSLNLGGQVERQVFSPDGASLAIVAGDTVTLWDVAARGVTLHGADPRTEVALFPDSLPPSPSATTAIGWRLRALRSRCGTRLTARRSHL